MFRPLLNCAEMAAADRAAQEDYRIPAALLMENAARSAAEFISGVMRDSGGAAAEPPLILAAAGKGNNGGDALAVTRHLFLAGRKNLRVILASRGLGELPRTQLAILEKLGIPVSVFGDDAASSRRLVMGASWIIDGLCGIGLKGPLKPAAAAFADILNESPARVFALDVPSGLGDGFCASWPVVKADYTLSFGAAKLCQYLPLGRKACGRIEILSAGFPPECLRRPAAVQLIQKKEALAAFLPRTKAADYKNSRGHIAVFAGKPGTTGAALLCAEASLAAGAGLASVFADAAAYPVLASACRSVMVKPLEAALPDWRPDGFQAVCAGPGWGREGGRAAPLKKLFACGLPGVLDADGLYVLRDMLKAGSLNLSGWVLTPHAGEFAALADAGKDEILAGPLPFMEEFCRKHHCVLVLKGHVTIIREEAADGKGGTWILDGMNPALGTAGSGDVLAGTIAALLGRGLAPARAAICGAALHSAAGGKAAKQKGFFTAEELLPYIGREAYSNAETLR